MNNLSQQQAHKILVDNNVLCGGNIPFNITTDYIGMIMETNAHRRLWNAPEIEILTSK